MYESPAGVGKVIFTYEGVTSTLAPREAEEILLEIILVPSTCNNSPDPFIFKATSVMVE